MSLILPMVLRLGELESTLQSRLQKDAALSVVQNYPAEEGLKAGVAAVEKQCPFLGALMNART